MPFRPATIDEEFARLCGVPVTLFYLLLCLVAVTVVLLIQVVGLILVIALLTLMLNGSVIHANLGPRER